ncbi:hypothetical protein BDL97_16G065900 [Sphagnum fallax]|nr:hypothetical protein BDL97_16G065900 [Sphagnum fallax]
MARLRMKLRASLTTSVYLKTVSVSTAERSCFSSGEIQTLMSVDGDRVVNLCASVHELWSLPLQMAVALGLLYMQVKFAFLAGLAVIILLIPVNRVIALKISASSDLMMKEKDERVRKMGELLVYMRTIKMYAWEHFFVGRILQSRNQELKQLSIRKYLDAFCVYFWACTPALFSLCTFGLFVLTGHTLDAATVFTSLSLFNILIGPLNSFPWVINGILEAQVSARRLRRYLSCAEIDPTWTKSLFSSTAETQNNATTLVPGTLDVTIPNGDDGVFVDEDCTIHKTQQRHPMAVVVQSADFTWLNTPEKNDTPTLTDISISIPRGSLVVVLGKVGSGKSSLLAALLGEMHRLNGELHIDGDLALVAQTPWIQAATLRDNVLFGSDFDAQRYEEVIKACALDVDIQGMQGNDLAEIGEQGLNLSGGQRARLALARALYQDSDIYLLDDPLSSVDAHVGKWLLQHVICGKLLSHKTRILCTYNNEAISFANLVLVLENGHIRYFGKPSGMDSSLLGIGLTWQAQIAPSDCWPSEQSLLDKPNVPLENSQKIGEEAPRSSVAPLSPYAEVNMLEHLMFTDGASDVIEGHDEPANDGLLHIDDEEMVASCEEEQVVPLVEDEARKEGRVKTAIYWGYASFAGWEIIGIILVSTALMQASRNGGDLWLSFWVDTLTSSTSPHLVSYYLRGMLVLAVANSLFTMARAFSFAYGGLRAAFYVHKMLLHKVVAAPITFFDRNPRGRILNRFSSDQYSIDDSLPFIANILLANVFMLSGIAIVLCYVQWTFLVVMLPIFYFFLILQRYYRATSRELRRLDSVSRSHVYTTFTEVLDGSGTIRAFKAQAQFVTKNWKMVATNMEASYSELSASLWLTFRLQMMAAFIVSFISIMAVIGHAHPESHIAAATAGLVGLGLSYSTPIIGLLSDLMTSFAETEKEMVSVERVQQVGMAGRTGAGKSSILNCLFRLSPVSAGSILIDGVNIAHVRLQRLRSRMTVVPQSPFLFGGTLRENLDPMGSASDDQLWEVLEKCHMKRAVIAAGQGLSLVVSEGGNSLSLGQRQLLCLARSLLSTACVLCLDECTANVDPHTTVMLKETVAKECSNMTVITIAHRVSTIIDLQHVLIMEHGRLVEEGPPQELLNNPQSKFSSLVHASHA